MGGLLVAHWPILRPDCGVRELKLALSKLTAALCGQVVEQLMARLYGSPMSETSRLPKPVASNWEWQYEGACRSLPTEMFFHPDGERGPRRKARENAAKAVCATCPVIAACRAHALAAQEPYGIWGGLTEEERLDIISKAQRQQRFFTA